MSNYLTTAQKIENVVARLNLSNVGKAPLRVCAGMNFLNVRDAEGNVSSLTVNSVTGFFKADGPLATEMKSAYMLYNRP